MLRYTLVVLAAILLSFFGLSCSQSRKPKKPASHISHYERRGSRERVIVFVHGIFGSAVETWRCPSGEYWPKMVAQDDAFRDSDIYVVAYDTPYFGNQMSIGEIVSNLNNRLESDGVFANHREVIFVAHSLGGLIVQELLLTHRNYAPQVRLIYFFSTPESGAQIAKLGQYFSADPLLKQMIPGDENLYLANLENQWRESGFTNVQRYCAYEKKALSGFLVVDRLSGTRGCAHAIAINEDHAGIVKPCSTADDSYIALRNAVISNPVRADDGQEGVNDSKFNAIEQCWNDFHRRSVAYVQKCSQHWKGIGLWPITLAATQQEGEYFLSGSFVPGPEQPFSYLVTLSEYISQEQQNRNRGFRPVQRTFVGTGRDLRVTTVWTVSNAPFETDCCMTTEDYERKQTQMRGRGYVQTDLSIYYQHGQTVSATWVKRPFKDYAALYDMRAEDYNLRRSQFEARGFRLKHFAPYASGAGWRYAALWELDDSVVAHHFDMTGNEYQLQYNNYISKGYSLSEVSLIGDRYSAIWAKK